MNYRNILGFLSRAAMLLPMVLSGGAFNPGFASAERPVTETKPVAPVTIEDEKEVYHGMTPSQLDAIPSVDYDAFDNAMYSSWNFAWDSVVTPEAIAEKVDFAGAAPDSKLWHLGTDGEEGACATGNAGWGVELY